MDVTTKAADVRPVESDHPHGEFDVILSTKARDRDGDELLPDEWKEPLPEHITFDSDHGMSVETTVGSGKPFINDDGQLQVRGTFASTPHAQNVRTLVNEGHIRSVSVSFMQRKSTKGAGVERELLNGAFVAVPANPEALVLSSKAAGGGHKTKEPYGNVAYADPGFRNDVKRYPINTPEHVRATWDYFQHANDRDRYSAAEQHHIEDEIRTAARKFGIKLEGDSQKSIVEKIAGGLLTPAQRRAVSALLPNAAGNKTVGDGTSDVDEQSTGVEAVLRNALTSLKTAVQLRNGQSVDDAPPADETYPHLRMIHDAAVQLAGNKFCSMAPVAAEAGQVWGANSPTISAPTSSGKSADAAASAASVAADAAVSADAAEALVKSNFMAINLLCDD